MHELIENNMANITGEVATDFAFDHERLGEKFYSFYIRVRRRSGVYDTLPVIVSERVADVRKSLKGSCVKIDGFYRSYNKVTCEKSRVLLFVLVRDIEPCEGVQGEHINHITLNGTICKEPVYRTTPMGWEIADLMIAVNRPYGKSDYIPCVFWGTSARFISNFGVGTKVEITGRIQSREYQKKISDTELEIRTAYEVSVADFCVHEEGASEK